jgi:2-polyprenyl-3-methyl-5-hydroxy-6-metoxy-1,4-benzoquinol methylase
MDKQALVNKKAWEHRAYEFWNNRHGGAAEQAAKIVANPAVRKHYRKYLDNVSGKKIANPCGSNGRQAVPLAFLGADVTVFDISEGNKRYALELAAAAGVSIDYVLGDFLEIDLDEYGEAYDIVYAEGGILHYFSDIDMFTKILFSITKPNGRLILSDFHPFRKISSASLGTDGDYFDKQIHSGKVAYQDFFPKDEQEDFPKCSLRFYTLSEIINSVITAGFTIEEFLEHPAVDDEKRPAEFTIIAYSK